MKIKNRLRNPFFTVSERLLRLPLKATFSRICCSVSGHHRHSRHLPEPSRRSSSCLVGHKRFLWQSLINQSCSSMLKVVAKKHHLLETPLQKQQEVTHKNWKKQILRYASTFNVLNVHYAQCTANPLFLAITFCS